MNDTDRPDILRMIHSAPDAAARFREALKQLPLPIRYGDELTTPPPTSVCDPWFYPGRLSTLTGEGGSGKSFLMARAEAAVLLGDAFPGPRRAQQRSVLHVNCDDLVEPKWQALYERMPGLQEIARDHLAMFEPPRAFRAEQVLPVFVRAVEQLAQQRPAFQPAGALIVIDTFRTFGAIEENSSQEVSEFLSALREVTVAGGPFPQGALCVSHHTGWQQVGVEAHERGSSAFRSNVDEPLMVHSLRQERKRQEEHNRLQRLKGYRVERLPPLATDQHVITVTRLKGKMAQLDPLAPGAYTFTLESVPVAWSDGRVTSSAWLVPYEMTAVQLEDASAEHARERSNEDDDAKVLAAVAAHDVSSKRDFARLTGLSERRAEGAVMRLVHAGQLLAPTFRGAPYRLPGGDTL